MFQNTWLWNFLQSQVTFLFSGCPYACLTDGPIGKRLFSKENKLILLNYLLSELQAARISAAGATCLNNDVINVSTCDVVCYIGIMQLAGFSSWTLINNFC